MKGLDGQTGEERDKELARLADLLEDTLPEAMQAILHVLSEDCRQLGVSLQQFYLLRLLQKRGYCTAAEIGVMLGITSGPVTHVTRRLIGQGLVRCTRDEQDRRVHRFTVTGTGEALIDRVSTRRKALWRAVFADLGPGKGGQIVSYIGRLGKRLEAARAELGPMMPNAAPGDVIPVRES